MSGRRKRWGVEQYLVFLFKNFFGYYLQCKFEYWHTFAKTRSLKVVGNVQIKFLSRETGEKGGEEILQHLERKWEKKRKEDGRVRITQMTFSADPMSRRGKEEEEEEESSFSSFTARFLHRQTWRKKGRKRREEKRSAKRDPPKPFFKVAANMRKRNGPSIVLRLPSHNNSGYFYPPTAQEVGQFFFFCMASDMRWHQATRQEKEKGGCHLSAKVEKMRLTFHPTPPSHFSHPPTLSPPPPPPPPHHPSTTTSAAGGRRRHSAQKLLFLTYWIVNKSNDGQSCVRNMTEKSLHPPSTPLPFSLSAETRFSLLFLSLHCPVSKKTCCCASPSFSPLSFSLHFHQTEPLLRFLSFSTLFLFRTASRRDVVKRER